ncbi:ABC transporter permease [Actinoallomurus iriomotensis]|uniref:ABC transporter permease n=1 Tax=Actinoallomurus iriomotensis TaxID=478107 RepID=A0A9W6VNM2_9ACTN|nr:ABC transporter permease [Actinoallomurus iriomotensis]GLY78938.1 ABC transporter permease [Actinoallomurus iriomotensis]
MSVLPTVAEPMGSVPAAPGRSSLLARIWRDRNGRIGLTVIVLLAVIAVLGALGVLPHDPIAQHPAARLQGPSSRYWFGTDQFGRDIAARAAVGIWTSLRVAVVSVAAAAVIGSVLGISAGFFGGWVDQIVSRFIDILFAFPAILLALAVVSALGNGWQNTAIAIAVVYTPIFTRVSRGPTLTVGGAEYIKAQRVLGTPLPRILLRHVLPNVSAPIVVQVTLALSWAILTESALSFLGLGTRPPTPSLGLMVSDARNTVATAWWTLTFPALAIVIAVITLNLLGDGLRSALDPRRDSRP